MSWKSLWMPIMLNIENQIRNFHHFALLSTKINVVYYNLLNAIKFPAVDNFWQNGGWDIMVRDIMRDEAFLSQKAEPAAQDLLDTLTAHKDGCVGMAANMIGVNKRIIVFDNEGDYIVMFNPEIVKKSGPYQAEEGCLSLSGIRKAKRWKSIKVQYQNEKFQTRFKTFTGWTAQIIQHEIDHCEGILIRCKIVSIHPNRYCCSNAHNYPLYK